MSEELIDFTQERTDKEKIEDIMKEDKGILLTTNTTSSTFTTKIKPWGYINLKKGILIEQITKNQYLCNIQGDINLLRVEYLCPSCGTKTSLPDPESKFKCSCGANLTIKENQGLYYKGFEFKINRKIKEPIYPVPDYNLLGDFLIYPQKVPSTEELFNEIVRFLEALFDFKSKIDSKIIALSILFTYVIPYFNSSFYLGIDATKGSGKTTLLEIISLLARHGFLADVSPASIPRLKEKYDLTIFTDEIDQLRNGEDLAGLMRRGQRRGNKYVRLNKNTLEEEIYEAFGFYGYSFRSVVEDAFKQRSILLRTARAKDSRLSIINLEKSTILKGLLTKIYAWYINSLLGFGSISSKVEEVVGTFTHDTNLREEIYNSLLDDFSDKEKKVLDEVLGRNSEIGFLLLKTSKFMGVDLVDDLEQVLISKQSEEETPDDYYYEIIKDLFKNILSNNPLWLLQKGEFAGFRYFPKTEFYMKLVTKLKENNLMGIGTTKYNQILKDIGFIQNYNIKNQKVKGENYPKPCLIFSQDVLKKLNVDYEPFVNPELKKVGDSKK